jgi:hypothetical protein
MANSTVQPASATTVQNPQPATTLQAPGGPFRRYTFPGSAPMYSVSGQAFGATITQALVANSSYLRRLRVQFVASGGAGTSVAGTADAPFNAVQQVVLQDANGTNIISLPGWEALYLLPKINGSFLGWNYSDPTTLPDYSPIAAATGDFTFSSVVPLEYLAGGIGCLGLNNAAQLPVLQWTLGSASAVYSTLPTTNPTLTVSVDADTYLIPDNVNIAPPGLGSSRQYKLLNGTPAVASTTTLPVYFPAFGGGFIDQLVFIARSSGGRTDAAWPNRLKLYIDGQLLAQPTFDELAAEFEVAFQTARPTGVLVFNFRNALSQFNTGLMDSAEAYVSTTPQSVIQLGDNWTGTANITAIVGQVIPSSAMITGVTGA